MKAISKRELNEAREPYVLWRSRAIVNRLLENDSPTPGLYYVVRWVNGWDIFPFRYDEHQSVGEIDHSDLWEMYVVKALAADWAKRLKVRPESIIEELAIRSYAFPRGRVTEAGGRKLLVLWGGDHAKLVGKSTVEYAFSCPGAKWELDEHEQCQSDDRDALRTILRLKETWPAV